jgi:hypothetical protein
MTIAAPLYGPGPEEPFALLPVPDLGGTEVADLRGRHAGTVYGTLADARSGLIRYLDVALHGSDRHVLIPLGHTKITREMDRTEVELRAATREELERIPPYEPHQAIDGNYQRAVLQAHGRLFHGERYYAHPAYDHAGLYAGEHPIIHETETTEPAALLRPLAELPEYQVAEGEPEVRGWPLVDRDDIHAGEIEDLLLEPSTGRVRYALARLEDGTATTPIPVGLLQIEEGERVVRMPTLTRDDVEAIPIYRPDHFTRTDEERILETIAARLDGERHFDRPDFVGHHSERRRSATE